MNGSELLGRCESRKDVGLSPRRASVFAAALLAVLVLAVGLFGAPPAQAGSSSLATGFTKDWPGTQLDLLILCDQSFCDALIPLKQYKDATGIDTHIESWQSVAQAFATQGRDAPERIKRALFSYKKQYGFRYLMLVGDVDKFPVRYTLTNTRYGRASDSIYMNTDYYYADLFRSDGSFSGWDADNDYYFGELNQLGKVNEDLVDLHPDLAVGRLPASTAAEVTTYVKKVARYEVGAYLSAWAKRALVIATTDWWSGAPAWSQTLIADGLASFDVTRLYQSPNSTGITTPLLNTTNIQAALNRGQGFVSYMGHGDEPGLFPLTGVSFWSMTTPLANSNALPTVFAAACDTAKNVFPGPGPYMDTSGTNHVGTARGETFSTVPPRPAPVQPASLDVANFGENLLVARAEGAVGYVGCNTGSQEGAVDLSKRFFQSYTKGWRALGDMYAYAVNTYYVANPDPGTIAGTTPIWRTTAKFHHPWKYNLFGDPSLRVSGIRLPVPALTSVSPACGSTAGGISVTINGSGFIGVTAVRFGTTAATSFTVNTPNRITAEVPAHAMGKVDVTVTTPGGTSSTTRTQDDYTYLNRYEQTNPSLVYAGSWSTGYATVYSGGSYAYAATRASVTIPFYGTRLDLVAKKDPGQGLAIVCVDGLPPVTVNLYSARPLYQRRVWSTGTLTAGYHWVKVSSGRAIPAGPPINIDAVEVLGTLAAATRFDDTNPRLLWSGSWRTLFSTSCFGGSLETSAQAAASVTARFHGIRISLIAAKGTGFGQAKLILDGGTPAYVDLYGPTELFRQTVWSSSFLAPGNHTLIVQSANLEDAASLDADINVDAFDVIGGLLRPLL